MKQSSLGQLELDVLKIIWDTPKSSVPEVIDRLNEKKDYARTTVLTVIQRLHKKGFLSREKRDGIYRYSPTSKKDTVLGNLAHQFLANTFDGSSAGLVQHLVSHEASAADLLEMQKIINAAINEEGNQQ